MATTYGMTLRRRPGKVLGDVVIAVVLVLVLAWALFPIYWAFINSIKNPGDTYGASWIPFLQFDPTLKLWRGSLACVSSSRPSRTAP